MCSPFVLLVLSLDIESILDIDANVAGAKKTVQALHERERERENDRALMNGVFRSSKRTRHSWPSKNSVPKSN